MADKSKERDPNQPSPSQYEQDMVMLGLRPGVDKTPEQKKDEHGNPVGLRMPVPDTEYDKVLAAKATETRVVGSRGRAMAAGPAAGYQTRSAGTPVSAPGTAHLTEKPVEKPKT